MISTHYQSRDSEAITVNYCIYYRCFCHSDLNDNNTNQFIKYVVYNASECY